MNRDKTVDCLFVFGCVVWFTPLLGYIGFILTSASPPIRFSCALLSATILIFMGVRLQKWFVSQPFIKTRLTSKDYRAFENLGFIPLPTAEEDAERHWKKRVW